MSDFQYLLGKFLETSIDLDRLKRKNYEDEAALCKKSYRIEDLEAEVENLKRSRDHLSLRNAELLALAEGVRKRESVLQDQMWKILNGDIVRLTVPPWPDKEANLILHIKWVRTYSIMNLSLLDVKRLHTNGGVILAHKDALLTEPYPHHVGLANKKE